LPNGSSSLPEGTPNHFLINVAPAELQPITDLLEENQVQRSHLFPDGQGTSGRRE
jgi:predicted lysophospholipase L1 biosynthesis ABC-type transport system permease subunit